MSVHLHRYGMELIVIISATVSSIKCTLKHIAWLWKRRSQNQSMYQESGGDIRPLADEITHLVTVLVRQPVISTSGIAVQQFITSNWLPLICPASKSRPLLDISPSAVSPIPLAFRVIARLVTISISDPGSRASFLTVRHWPSEVHLLASSVSEEIVRPHITAEHDIIIEVQEVVWESWDAV